MTSSLLQEKDIYYAREGTHAHLYRVLGAHPVAQGKGRAGVQFGVWAPNAESVSVMGDFNAWNVSSHPLSVRADDTGIWEGFVPGIEPGARYKYHIVSKTDGYRVDKADPLAFYCEQPPATSSIVWGLDYEWEDETWMRGRSQANALDAPWSIYELHLGSWRRVPEEGNRSLTYREIAPRLVEYVKEMGFTHVELLPVMEHPFYGSWGYQITGFFAPSSRYGTPQDFMYLIDCLHRNGIGVILDWVPSHFPDDAHGLSYFDGTCLYEHEDPRRGFHQEWGSYIFNYGRHEVRSFLVSNALFWLDVYHIDALRVDAVASMLYLDYGRAPGQWIPNQHGGREDLEAVEFLRNLNTAVYREYPDTQTIAEESTAWPQVSRPVHLGGLGFGMKWNMGWMHDTLKYFQTDPVFRKFSHNALAFSIWYAFSENFVLALSHDEVVHGKRSLIGKMFGDEWQARANLRALYGYMWGHPGKKLIFMGDEFGQHREWQHDESLQWHLLDDPAHQGLRNWVGDLNRVYREVPALHERDFSQSGFEWIDCDDAAQSVLSFIRRGQRPQDVVLVVCNFTPVVRDNYRVGVPRGGRWMELLNSDAAYYGGSGQGNFGGNEASPLPYGGRPNSLTLTLPPLGVIYLIPTGDVS